jgi:hypothetical protein
MTENTLPDYNIVDSDLEDLSYNPQYLEGLGQE